VNSEEGPPNLHPNFKGCINSHNDENESNKNLNSSTNLFNNRPRLMMKFVKVPGLKGKVYVPEKQSKSLKKHPCKDCFYCQSCSDDRCRVCLGPKNHKCWKTFGK